MNSFGFRRRRRVALVLVPALAGTLLAAVGPAAPARAAEGGDLVIANVLWRVAVGSRPDLMTTNNPAERDQFPVDGQTHYVPKYSGSGRSALYRLHNPNWYGGSDHMDSRTAGEAGFGTEYALGYPYTSQAAGTQPYLRTFNGCTGDHGTRSQNEGAKPCYGDEAGGHGYAWPRYLNTATSLASLSAGGVTISSNRVTGGALWNWTYDGTQYINNLDYGRQLQSSLFFSRDGVTANPTEAGDTWSNPAWPAYRRHGSPLLALNTDAASKTQSTRSMPIDFVPQNFGGGEQNPAIYRDFQLGKDITLDWGGLGPVARYQTVLNSPALTYPGIEVPTAYLRAEFNRYFTYDAVSQTLTERTNFGQCSDASYFSWTPPNRGGVIIANADLTKAMAVYGANTSQGGSVSEMRMYKFIGGGCGTGTGEFDIASSKFTVLRHGNVGAGEKRFNSWVMTGSVGQIQGWMNTLRSWGAA
ncbi:hypothetical protein [Micromonospora sp. WMMD712]|uniref:hypothetical protein n=1 Tax=Micromonospora sp. WMMD712 TaxID=3016096 RepID=UPI00249CEE45|nr:hypothetical protein [Micromonospora sp. WMMD712]WFE59957.1 hypothetical protein O7633_25315 [Micromonospora sp. WMMD712]